MILYAYLISVIITFVIISSALFYSWWEGDEITQGDLFIPLFSLIPLWNIICILIVLVDMVQTNSVVFKGRKK